MSTLALGALAVTGVVAGWGTPSQPEPDVNSATVPASVYAAQATAATDAHDSSYVRGESFNRFITIWLENTDYDKAAGDPNLAWLAQNGITLENYFGVTHPSEPNYIASVGGDNFGADNDNFNQIDANVSSVMDLLEARGISWGSYEEDMPYTGFEGFSWINQETGKNDYVRKHNPPVLYDENTTPARLSYQKNFTQFCADLEAKQLPQWMFITPNMTDDGHDSSVTVAGTWARGFLEPLMKNEYFMKDTLILITFDENETQTDVNRVFSILLGGAVRGKEGTKDANYYNHYSEIATVEANWCLNTLGRWDVGANVFQHVAEKTGDIVRPNTAITGSDPTIFQNSSYAGPFNTGFANASYPAPNINIVSPKTGRTVLPAIKRTWGNKPSIYNNGVVIPDGQHPPAGYAVNNVTNS
ncbi:hypothetical protein B0A55_02406 [Friedmanniomyces simplex]|uniref:Acid phosphatase n=1 Tax=Friedmanniomyces simplex TaxID=329884 RepID=A0A4U0XUF0_9PEZI|nr:hypothetical protein B0A55_02406 [Friedmanniomyces simplex]